MKNVIITVALISSLVIPVRGEGQLPPIAKEAEARSYVQITQGAPSAAGGYYQLLRNSHSEIAIRATILTVAVPGGTLAHRQILLAPGKTVSLGDSVVQNSEGSSGYKLAYAITAAKFESDAKKPNQSAEPTPPSRGGSP